MADPNLPLLEDAVRKLAPFLDEIVFVGGITLGLLITDVAAAPIRGTTDVVLELGSDKPPGVFGGMIATDPRLGIVLQFRKRHGDSFAMSIAHALIAANQCRERYRLWRTEGRIPSCPVLDGFYRFAVGGLILVRLVMLD